VKSALPCGLAQVIAAGADVVIRASWQSARWLDKNGACLDLDLALVGAQSGIGGSVIDRPVQLARKGSTPLALRLVAVNMPRDKATQSVLKARKEAKSNGRKTQPAICASHRENARTNPSVCYAWG
jgi:hypothetical protein